MLKPVHTRRFGQHFLHDKHYVQRIINAVAIKPSECLIEIGPGGGALTEHLLPLVGKLIAIEIDGDLCNHLSVKFADDKKKLFLYNQDVLQTDFSQCIEPHAASLRLVGNLPYNVATPILFRLLQYRQQINEWYVMLQKEVADRLTATPKNKDYSRLSVMMQYYCQIEQLFRVRPGAFTPPPKVESTVVKIIPWKKLPIQANNEALFAKIVKQAFSQRRKQIINSLKALGIQSEQLMQCGINPKARAEELTANDYVTLTNVSENMIN